MSEKRQVCIRTWFGTENYGSNLQAVGLSKTLESLGYDVYFLKKFRVIPFMIQHPMLLLARVYNAINLRKSKKFFVPVPYEVSAKRRQKINQFSKTFFKEKTYIKMSTWRNDIKKNVIFIAGSDILWNPAKGYPATSFLDFAYYAKLPCFSYASSVGALELPKNYYAAYRRYLGNMKAIGVREQAVADMFQPIIGKKPTKVVDPSLLLPLESWNELVEKAKIPNEIHPNNFVLCYYVMNDPRYWEYIKKVQTATGLQIVVLPMHEMDEKQPYSIILDGTLYEFLWLIKNAAFVCTDSFHACVASIIYHKEFYLLRRTRKAEDAKYDDLLGRYHLEERNVKDESKFERNTMIDYSFVDEKIKKDREFSLEFLKKALDKC